MGNFYLREIIILNAKQLNEINRYFSWSYIEKFQFSFIFEMCFFCVHLLYLHLLKLGYVR